MSISPQTRARLRLRYLQALPARRDVLGSLQRRVGAEDRAAYDEARRLGHQFAGMGASFGFDAHSEAGRALEHAADPELAAALSQLLLVIDQALTPRDDAEQADGTGRHSS